MLVRWSRNDIKEHLDETPELKTKNLMVMVRHVGDGDTGDAFDVRVHSVSHNFNPETGVTYMEILVDASRERVRN